MHIALAEGGAVRVVAATLADIVGLRRLASRLRPARVARLWPPCPGAVPPADASVVRPPLRPDEAAATLREALRYSLRPELGATLAGCAVVAADATGVSSLGYAPGPHADATLDGPRLIAELCAGNPAGQGDQGTPLVLFIPAPPDASAREIPRTSVVSQRTS
jgi:hypothetical protein